jgi:hypothetical protein
LIWKLSITSSYAFYLMCIGIFVDMYNCNRFTNNIY